MSIESRERLRTFVSGNTNQSAYVGFRKKVIDSLDRSETPSADLVRLKHEQNKLIVTKPFHRLGFTCYVTKPLTFHGTFRIQAFSGDSATITDKYIYNTIYYNIDKSSNLITATVNAFAQPWTISDLQKRDGA